MRKNITGYDAFTIRLRESNQSHWTWRFFIKHCTQCGCRNYLFKHSELSPVKILFLLLGAKMAQFKRPDAYLGDFKRIKDIHGNSIRSLICQVTANSAAKPLKSLTNVNRFAVVVVKGINTPLAPADFVSFVVRTLEESLYLLANQGNIRRQANGLSLTSF